MLAVLADIHGIGAALEAVLADLPPQTAGILVAGDLTRGPDDNHVIERLRALGAHMIRGNTDEDLLHVAAGQAEPVWYTHKQYAAARWCSRQLTPAALQTLGALPEQLTFSLPGAPAIRVVHGSPRDPDEHLYPQRDPQKLERSLEMIEEAVLVCGHTHQPWQERRGGQLALNPGSVGLPLHGRPQAQYALLHREGDGWRAELRAVDYDGQAVRWRFEESGFLEGGGAFARALCESAATGHDHLVPFFRYLMQIMHVDGIQDMGAVPDAVWDAAVESFDWEGCASERD